MMMNRLSVALLVLTFADGFIPTIRSHHRKGSPLFGASPVQTTKRRIEAQPDILKKDDEETKAQRVKIRNIERDWTFQDFEGTNSMTVDLFLPEKAKPKGCVFFMHGFSQYPIAYRKTLRKLTEQVGVAVVAVETGLTNKVAFDLKDSQFALQRAVSQDTVQCVQMVQAGDEPFGEHIPRNVPLGLCGHSMGGGLCFDVATQIPEIDYLFAMAPAPGVDVFDPFQSISERAAKHSMMLAGSWDLIAKAGTVKELFQASKAAKKNDSAMFAEISRGLHTGFQDEIVLFHVPLKTVLGLILDFDFLLEHVVLNVLQFLRSQTGQLAITRELMAYVFEQMVKDKPLSAKGAEEALDHLKEKWQDKVTIDS